MSDTKYFIGTTDPRKLSFHEIKVRYPSSKQALKRLRKLTGGNRTKHIMSKTAFTGD